MTLKQAFLNQATSCARLGSPFMGRLLTLLAENWPEHSALAHKFDQFDGDIGPSGHSLPLRLAGGLHALVLNHQDDALIAAYPPNAVDDATLAAAVLAAIDTHAAFLLTWTDNAPQTNEVRRAATMIAAAHVAVTAFDQPLHVSELGASGGLNLMWDHFALEIEGQRFGPSLPALTFRPDWTGSFPPPATPRIASRGGVDLNPLDPGTPEDMLRLMAYLWPDQADRLSSTRAAASVVDAIVDKGDAVDWLKTRLEEAPAGHLHFIQHSVAWQYFPAAAQKRGRDLIEAAGAQATPDRPLAWFAMESDGDTQGDKGAALTLRLWPGDISLMLGRADFHGRWVHWDPQSLS